MKPGVKMIRLPNDLAPETFIGGGCGLVTALHAVDMAHVRLGESVAVLGVGPVGQSIVALAALSGASEVIAVGAPDDRLAFARRMGATHTIGLDLTSEDRVAAVRAATRGRGADVVIEASGSPDAVSQALDMVRDGGRVVDLRPLHGQRSRRDPPALADQSQARRDPRLLGLAVPSLSSRRASSRRASAIASRGTRWSADATRSIRRRCARGGRIPGGDQSADRPVTLIVAGVTHTIDGSSRRDDQLGENRNCRNRR